MHVITMHLLKRNRWRNLDHVSFNDA